MSQTEANILRIQKFSTEDGPGIRTTIFFKGCPMRCPWCHNPEALRTQPDLVWYENRCIAHRGCVDVCPEKALTFAPEALWRQITHNLLLLTGHWQPIMPQVVLDG